MNKTYNFHGKIISLEPMTVSLPNQKNGQRLPRNGGAEGKPYFPGTSLRGAIRHFGHQLSVRKQEQSGHPKFDYKDHFLLAQGIDSANDIELSSDAEIDANKELREKNPMLSLWGLWGLNSKVGVGCLYPTTDDCWGMFGMGARSNMFLRTPELLDLLSDDDKAKLNVLLEEEHDASKEVRLIKGQIRDLKSSLKGSSPDERKNIMQQISKLEDQIANVKDQKTESRESIQRPLDGYEAFAANTEFNHHMCLRDGTDVELGLLLATLIQFAHHPYLGGHFAHNAGRISAHWDITYWADDELTPTHVGSISFDATGVHLEGDKLKEAIDAWKAFSGDLGKQAILTVG